MRSTSRGSSRGMLDVERGLALWGCIPDPQVDYRFMGMFRDAAHGACGERRAQRILTVECSGDGPWGDSELPVTLDEARNFAASIPRVPEYMFKLLDLLEPVAGKMTATQSRICRCPRARSGCSADAAPQRRVGKSTSSVPVASCRATSSRWETRPCA